MKNLNLNCAIGETGYGVVSLNILKALSKLDINISLFPMGTSYSVNSEEEKSIIHKLANNATNFDYNSLTWLLGRVMENILPFPFLK